MSITLTLASRSSELEQDISPEITLDRPYSLALIGLYTYNSIPNIEEGRNNKFSYYKDGSLHEIAIPEGAYEITDIEKYLQTSLKSTNNESEVISLKPNNNTLKCMLKCTYEIDFTAKDSIAYLLGFSNRKLAANTLHSSDRPVDIIRVNLILVECNLVFGSYLNSKQTHVLYEFKPNVDPGYAITATPAHLIYQKEQENLGSIRQISVRLTDQNSELINFRGEEIIVRLELKPC